MGADGNENVTSMVFNRTKTLFTKYYNHKPSHLNSQMLEFQ